MLRAERANTILYCTAWNETVAFYRDLLELPVTFQNDWFVEFEVAPAAYLSVADASRSTVAAGDGRGLTLSWQVDDVVAARGVLVAHGVAVSEVRTRFGSPVVDLHDPAGTRIELWSPHQAVREVSA